MGGEFEIDVINFKNLGTEFPAKFRKGQFYSSGRAALYHILKLSRKLGKNKILLPDFLCDSIIETVKLLKHPYEFYKINIDLTIDIESIKRGYTKECQILIINYFGGIDIGRQIKSVKQIDSQASIILDNVQALFHMFSKVNADFVFTSFRKILPVPDGGWVLTESKGLEKCEGHNEFAKYKVAGGILKAFKNSQLFSDELFLELFDRGESLIIDNLNATISDSTIRILNGLDFKFIREKRIKNAKIVLDRISKMGITPLLNFDREQVPLFVPVLLSKRDYIRKELQKQNIFCPVHWHRSVATQHLDQKLYEMELSLLVDQRYDEGDLDKMISVIEKCI